MPRNVIPDSSDDRAIGPQRQAVTAPGRHRHGVRQPRGDIALTAGICPPGGDIWTDRCHRQAALLRPGAGDETGGRLDLIRAHIHRAVREAQEAVEVGVAGRIGAVALSDARRCGSQPQVLTGFVREQGGAVRGSGDAYKVAAVGLNPASEAQTPAAWVMVLEKNGLMVGLGWRRVFLSRDASHRRHGPSGEEHSMLPGDHGTLPS